jgi:hypothetical protein
MDLVQAEKAIGCDPHLLGHPPPIFRDMGGVIVGTKAAIEALVNAAGHAAFAGKEGVAQARNGRK